MPDIYMPRKLPRTREYPGYQFYCTLRKRNENAEACFCFAAMCVIDWLKQRLRDTDAIPDQLARLPEHRNASGMRPDMLESFTISSGFSAYVVALPAHGIWSLRLKEPDSDTTERAAVPGRFFSTNVGLHIADDEQVELGIRIDVTDPDEIPEVDYAFRPRFVRDLYAEQDIVLTQANSELPYQQAMPVESEEQFRCLRSILESSDCLLPVVLVTQAVRVPKEEPLSVLRQAPVLPSPTAPAFSLFTAAFQSAPVVEQYYPFDADDIASHSFGHAIVCRVAEKQHESLAKRLKKNYMPGDVLLVEPKRFGRVIRILGKDDKNVVQQVWQYTHGFSKDRRYSFGDVIFEFDARGIESRERIAQIQASGDMRLEEKITRLNQTIDKLQEENISLVRKISELREQLLTEHSKGEEAEKRRNASLYEEYEQHEEALRKAQARILSLEQENRSARAIQSAVETLRSMPELPRTNEDVVSYFQRVFGDRIAFTERGRKTAVKCNIKPEGLWFYLYCMATSLYEIHHANHPDVEKALFEATGIEVAMGEGSQSRKDNRIMNLRIDTYEGKEISVEPHVKLSPSKAGADHQRIYYCYDHELDRIIIGSVGEHLRTAGTIHVS